ncbi:MAG: hypothetical protein EBT13_08250 [Rhodobacteraceae bacterium]|nr:hypothetical protein [Paracoccaceae bacterium]
MQLALIVMIPFVGALLPPLFVRHSRAAAAFVAGLSTLASLTLLLSKAPAVLGGEIIQISWVWLPQLGLNIAFFIDGLGLLFAGLILGIGLLIIIYAHYYLSQRDPAGRFFSYLLLFQGAMVGIVLSENMLLLLVFWELTSLSSFLLIGFWRHLPEAVQQMPWAANPDTLRKHALIVTGFHNVGSVEAGSKRAAKGVAAFVHFHAISAHGYAITKVEGAVVTCWTPVSQSMRAMGGKEFQRSKEAVLNWIADQIGVRPEQLRESA